MTTKADVIAVIDKIMDDLKVPKTPPEFYEWYLSSKQAREVEACGGLKQWFEATQEERDKAVASWKS